jgi:hypothetical protein
MSTDQHPAAAPPGGRSGSNGMGVAGFVTGLLGLLLSWIPIAGIVLGALGIVLGGVGISQGRKAGGRTGLATAGVVLGALAVVVAIVLIAVVVESGAV